MESKQLDFYEFVLQDGSPLWMDSLMCNRYCQSHCSFFEGWHAPSRLFLKNFCSLWRVL